MNTTFTSFCDPVKPQPVAKMLRHPNERPAFLTSNHCDIDYSTDLPPLPFQSKLFLQAWSCIAGNFDKGGRRGDHKHKIMDRSFKPK